MSSFNFDVITLFPKAFELINKISTEDHVMIYATNSSSTPKGPDLGGAFQGVLRKPIVAVLSGEGTSSYGVGEVWHLLSNRMRIPASLLDANNLTQDILDELKLFQSVVSPKGYRYNSVPIPPLIRILDDIVAVENAKSQSVLAKLATSPFSKLKKL